MTDAVSPRIWESWMWTRFFSSYDPITRGAGGTLYEIIARIPQSVHASITHLKCRGPQQ